MARIRSITFKYQRKIDLGQYNGLVLDMMPTVEIDENDDIDDVCHRVWSMCRANIEHAAGPIVQGYRKNDVHGLTTKELFLGLPVETAEIEKEN